MNQQSQKPKSITKGCIITLIIICAIPMILFVFGIYASYSDYKYVEDWAKEATSKESLVQKYGNALPDYVIEEIYPVPQDPGFFARLRFKSPITHKDIKSLKKDNPGILELGDNRYQIGGLMLEVGSDIGMYEECMQFEPQ